MVSHFRTPCCLKKSDLICVRTIFPFQDEIIIMFIKMEEPKDFVTWLQVAKLIVLAYHHHLFFHLFVTL
jgi:hypothetical protein